jgi:mRNA interferase MazF
VLTRSEVLDVRALVTVAEITTSIRGLGVEVEVDPGDVDLDQPSVINCDGLYTVPRASLTTRLGAVSEATLDEACSAVAYALGC